MMIELIVLGFLFVLVNIVLGPPGSRPLGPQSSALQTSRSIGLCLYSYATDHNGKYPDGQSSTEVFQKLLDENYINDPSIFYLPLPGKSEGRPGQKLKPENVCWDITSGVESSTPDEVPLVFITGYKVNYRPGGEAVTLPATYEAFRPKNWEDWLLGKGKRERNPLPGIAVEYKGNFAIYLMPGDFVSSRSENGFELRINEEAKFKGIYPNFISPDFKPDGKTYRQLTPDGVLPEK